MENNRNRTITPAERDLIQTEYAKVWEDDRRMIDYCVNQTAAIAILPAGEIITIEKRSIHKDFWFGEHGYDYDEVYAEARRAEKSECYFRQRNMEHFDRLIRCLTESMNGEGNQRLIIYTKGKYIGQPDDCRLRNYDFARLYDIIDACGGSCCLDELPGKELTVRFQECRIATREEHEIILRVVTAVAQAHERRIDTYLKRYGLSMVHADTYWADR